MRVAIVGGGPAGLTAAALLESRGWEAVLFESHSTTGGRTHTEHFGEGHWLDTGAGWLASFYPSTLALLAATGLDDLLSPMRLRGGGDLLIDGAIVPAPNSIGRILRTSLLTPAQKAQFFWWMTRLFAVQRSNLALDLAHDAETAEHAVRGAGDAATERIIRPNLEGPFFARLERMSGTLARTWLRSLSVGTFLHVDGGMDHPWRALAAQLAKRMPIHLGTPVARVEISADGRPEKRARVHVDGEWRSFDAVVLAVPAPVAAQLLGEQAPPALSSISYAPHVRAYVARPSDDPPPRTAIHLFPNHFAATLERGGLDGWGAAPPGWEWVLVCAPSDNSGDLIGLERDTALDLLFGDVNARLGEAIQWRDYDVVHLVRWDHAVPIVDPGYYARIARIPQRSPLVFAGDWRFQPCVEGAVRSAEMAVSALVGERVSTSSLSTHRG